MKIKKILLLSAAMMLSAVVSAQDAVTHRYPEVKFKIGSQEYTVPAWDVWANEPNINGHIRVQRKSQNADGSYVGKIVTRYAIYDNAEESNRLYVTSSNQTVTIEGKGNFKLKDLKYSDVFGTVEGINYNIPVYEYTGIPTIKGDYTIPVDFTPTGGDHYLVDEIGDYAFRQPSRNEYNYNWFTPGTITIPKEITSIGRGAFFMNLMKKVVFEEGSTVSDIKEFNFQDCLNLEEITFPSSVTTLTGTVLGGCPALKRINFAGTTAPELTTFRWAGNDYEVFETSTSAGATVKANCVVSVPLWSYNDESDWYDNFDGFLFSSPVTLGKDMITFCSDMPFTVKQYSFNNDNNIVEWKDGELKASYVESKNISETSVGLTEITGNAIIPGIFGVILSGTAGQTYDIFYNPDGFEELDDENMLIGVVENTEITIQEGCSYFVLSDGKFHPVFQNGTIAAHKAYLMVDEDEISIPITSTSSKSVYMVGADVSGIESTEAKSAQDGIFYTLQGMPVSQPTKGLFIKNGKKIIIK